MGKSSALKSLRGQIRQIVRELLPELLTEQLVMDMQKNLSGQLREGLGKIDDRQAQLQSYFVRNAGVPDSKSQAPKQE